MITFTAADGLALVGERTTPARMRRAHPVVLVHGIGFSRRHWKRQVAGLVTAGYEAITIDMRGSGDSALPDAPYTIATLAADLERLRQATAVERFHLVGHSLGGMVAQRYAIDHGLRVAALVLASTANHIGRRAGAFVRAMTLLSEGGFDQVTADPARRAEVEAILKEAVPYVGPVMELLRELTREPSRARALQWHAVTEFSVKDRAAAIACPTLVMHGTDDQNIPFAAGRLVHQAIPGSRWLAFEGAAHDLPVEQADAFGDALLDFLGACDHGAS